ncbi:MAG: hypothetical protein KDB00_16090 [Planctomycetales bacterium]|nr:hypothetical protein [Planctomycetales bacterium]
MKFIQWIVLLAISSNIVVADETEKLASESGPSAKDRQRWSASADRSLLCGTWRLVEKGIAFSSQEEKLIAPLTTAGAELKIDDHGFRISGTEVAGKLSNTENKIEFLPERFWLNTDEPKLRLSLPDGTITVVSYVVNEDSLAIRYPANSCSRSGVRFTFKRALPVQKP